MHPPTPAGRVVPNAPPPSLSRLPSASRVSRVCRVSPAFRVFLLALAFAPALRAQFELSGGSFNTLFTPQAPVGPAAIPTQPQFSGKLANAGGSGAISISTTPGHRFPSAVQQNVVLARSTVGSAFANGLPRYRLGDTITPPATTLAGTPAAADYWRAEPVRPGEPFVQGNGSAVTPLAADAPRSYYFSPHAGRVFASQAGQIAVKWVTRLPEGGDYRFRDEVFSVSSATTRPVRKLFWTERGFNSPPVSISPGKIELVNPIYSASFPARVAAEYRPPGYNPAAGSASPPEETRTLWFEKSANLGQIRAYNQEGRIFVEYLGAANPAVPGTHQFLGADIIEVARSAPSINVTVDLGQPITPRDELGRLLPLSGSPEWLGSPVFFTGTQGQIFYGSVTRPDGRTRYFAERENDNPDRVVFYWLEAADAAIYHSVDAPNLDLSWPQVRNNYIQRWPAALSSYVHYVVPSGGSTAATGIQFPARHLPEIVFQDDGAQTQASFDASSQRVTVTLGADTLNRSLIRFTSGNEVWYVPLYTQSENNPAFAEGDGQPVLHATAHVGDRIEPPFGYSRAGYIAAGTHYLPAAYVDPFTAGAATAERGAIIPVNTRPTAADNELRVWWFKRIEPPSAQFDAFYVPSKIGRYTVAYPTPSATIVIAANRGSGDLPADQLAGSLYFQNNPALPGYNPNEEHALIDSGRVYALRDDLNVTSGAGFTSQPFALLRYTSAADSRPAVRLFHVVREQGTDVFDYAVVAGTKLQPPLPLAKLPLPLDAQGNVLNREVSRTESVTPVALAPSHYQTFTFVDRQGYHWIYRGPHAAGGTGASLGMQFYYPMQESFSVPGRTVAVGTPLPFLRPLANGSFTGDPVTGTPLTIHYRPTWPMDAPELRIGESLTRAKFGLPEVFSQSSAEVYYQQSKAVVSGSPSSVVLHDPIREKTFALGGDNRLQSLPASVAVTSYQGRTYFQRVPAHLQRRFYFDATRGTKGSLVLTGALVDEPVGEDYLHLNTLSESEIATLVSLVATTDAQATPWADAVRALATTVETFVPDSSKPGTYKSDGAPVVRGVSELPRIENSDTAVVDYALTATGAADGWVTLLFGNGRAFTPTAEPVALQVVRVVPRLYRGELKALLPENPLDEQVVLRHSGDFAARPQDYEFEWRYAGSQDGAAPPIYRQSLTAWPTPSWLLARSPTSALPASGAYTETVSLPRSTQIYAGTGSTTRPGLVLQPATALDFTAGIPQRIVFSGTFGPADGFVLYVNGVAALACRAPSGFANVSPVAGLVPTDVLPGGLDQQFTVNPHFFVAGPNRLEVALYSTAPAGTNSVLDFRVHTSSTTDLIATGTSPWRQLPSGLPERIVIGGSPTAPLGSPLLVLSDNWFTVRYRPRTDSGSVAANDGATPRNYAWSDWMEPRLVEGWVKRVLAAINPFNQRMRDLYHNAVNTDVSLLTQAGRRWEGDIALNLGNINAAGLIEIYETVLNRARSFSVDAGYDDPGVNDALLLVAGYLADLYTILGNEAFADAANPTISVDDATTVTEVNTSRFAFESQVKSVLDEELALLRGRDDLLSSPGVTTAPVYNRLYWNFTRGINSGEAIYAVNYNIREKSGAPTADGTLDAADAQHMFPQGHGDAYGHYLTALKGYYRLLRNPKFTWTPRAESVTVLGQALQIDYADERKFAAAAASLARTAQQVVALTHRQSYKDDPAAGWSSFRDGKTNATTGTRRDWGLDDWASRATLGAYVHWAVANALLPDKDTQPGHSGIQVIDRTTVPDLAELTTLAADFQTRLDNANARLNPLELSPGAIAFDISPADLKAGKSHYEQINERALRAVLNAKGAFDQAARMTRLLRNQENQLTANNAALADQERAFERRLVELYGTPYAGDIGPGKTYPQGYTGPDEINWFVIDRPSDAVDTTKPVSVNVRVARFLLPTLANSPINPAALLGGLDLITEARSVAVQPDRIAQFPEFWFGSTAVGVRRSTGTLQQALLDSFQAQLAARAAMTRFLDKHAAFSARAEVFIELIENHNKAVAKQDETNAQKSELKVLASAASAIASFSATMAQTIKEEAGSAIEFEPTVLGLSNDTTSPIRGTISVVATNWSKAYAFVGAIANATAAGIEAKAQLLQFDLDKLLKAQAFDYQQVQSSYELEMAFREMLSSRFEVVSTATQAQRAFERVRNLIAEGERILAERLIFRQRAAAAIQGYRTRDVTFRTFRNEALEQYRSLFDLAGRYTYLAAKSYDYETGLLGTAAGQSVLEHIVASRSLGDLTGGVPQTTVSNLGDAGLAGTMARLQADWAVAKGRLGINNPDASGTLFSLRRELFRIPDDPTTTDDDAQWQQTLEQRIVPNLLADADVAALCRNLRNADGSNVPGIIIPFSTTITDHQNFFGLPLAPGDHAFTPSNYATKIYSVGTVFRGYIGMDPYAVAGTTTGTPNSTDPKALSAAPYVYLIPTGTDFMLAPPLGDTGAIRGFVVRDQALPLPFNLGATQFSATQFFNANGTLSEQPWIVRKHQSFRPVGDPSFFYSTVPAEFTNTRLVGRSVWNSGWKLVIPAKTLLANEQEGLNRFVASVKDIELFLRTYSHSGN